MLEHDARVDQFDQQQLLNDAIDLAVQELVCQKAGNSTATVDSVKPLLQRLVTFSAGEAFRHILEGRWYQDESIFKAIVQAVRPQETRGAEVTQDEENEIAKIQAAIVGAAFESLGRAFYRSHQNDFTAIVNFIKRNGEPKASLEHFINLQQIMRGYIRSTIKSESEEDVNDESFRRLFEQPIEFCLNADNEVAFGAGIAKLIPSNTFCLEDFYYLADLAAITLNEDSVALALFTTIVFQRLQLDNPESNLEMGKLIDDHRAVCPITEIPSFDEDTLRQLQGVSAKEQRKTIARLCVTSAQAATAAHFKNDFGVDDGFFPINFATIQDKLSAEHQENLQSTRTERDDKVRRMYCSLYASADVSLGRALSEVSVVSFALTAGHLSRLPVFRNLSDRTTWKSIEENMQALQDYNDERHSSQDCKQHFLEYKLCVERKHIQSLNNWYYALKAWVAQAAVMINGKNEQEQIAFYHRMIAWRDSVELLRQAAIATFMQGNVKLKKQEKEKKKLLEAHDKQEEGRIFHFLKGKAEELVDPPAQQAHDEAAFFVPRDLQPSTLTVGALVDHGAGISPPSDAVEQRADPASVVSQQSPFKGQSILEQQLCARVRNIHELLVDSKRLNPIIVLRRLQNFFEAMDFSEIKDALARANIGSKLKNDIRLLNDLLEVVDQLVRIKMSDVDVEDPDQEALRKSVEARKFLIALRLDLKKYREACVQVYIHGRENSKQKILQETDKKRQATMRKTLQWNVDVQPVLMHIRACGDPSAENQMEALSLSGIENESVFRGMLLQYRQEARCRAANYQCKFWGVRQRVNQAEEDLESRGISEEERRLATESVTEARAALEDHTNKQQQVFDYSSRLNDVLFLDTKVFGATTQEFVDSVRQFLDIKMSGDLSFALLSAQAYSDKFKTSFWHGKLLRELANAMSGEEISLILDSQDAKKWGKPPKLYQKCIKALVKIQEANRLANAAGIMHQQVAKTDSTVQIIDAFKKRVGEMPVEGEQKSDTRKSLEGTSEGRRFLREIERDNQRDRELARLRQRKIDIEARKAEISIQPDPFDWMLIAMTKSRARELSQLNKEQALLERDIKKLESLRDKSAKRIEREATPYIAKALRP